MDKFKQGFSEHDKKTKRIKNDGKGGFGDSPGKAGLRTSFICSDASVQQDQLHKHAVQTCAFVLMFCCDGPQSLTSF